jgi:hypothetical protein
MLLMFDRLLPDYGGANLCIEAQIRAPGVRQFEKSGLPLAAMDLRLFEHLDR